MNTIILSAILGVVMMFSGIFIHNKAAFKNIAIAGLLILLGFNVAEHYGFRLFEVNTTNLLHFERFGILFNSICIFSTLIFVMLSGRDAEKVGNYVAEYFALIFFVICGIGIITSYTNLMMLFIGIEIISIPLYILTAANRTPIITSHK